MVATLTLLLQGLGLARLLIDAALTWASNNADKILPPMSPAAAEQRKLELGGGVEVEDVWRGLVLVHAQAHLEKSPQAGKRQSTRSVMQIAERLGC